MMRERFRVRCQFRLKHASKIDIVTARTVDAAHCYLMAAQEVLRLKRNAAEFL